MSSTFCIVEFARWPVSFPSVLVEACTSAHYSCIDSSRFSCQEREMRKRESTYAPITKGPVQHFNFRSYEGSCWSIAWRESFSFSCCKQFSIRQPGHDRFTHISERTPAVSKRWGSRMVFSGTLATTFKRLAMVPPLAPPLP